MNWRKDRHFSDRAHDLHHHRIVGRSHPCIRDTSTARTRWICWPARGPSKRHEVFYFGGPHLGALPIDDFKFQFFQQPYERFVTLVKA